MHPATAGAAKLVPDSVRPTAVTAVPLAVMSGSSRSRVGDAGLRNTESPDMAPAVSSWLPTTRQLNVLWLTYPSEGGLMPSESMAQ